MIAPSDRFHLSCRITGANCVARGHLLVAPRHAKQRRLFLQRERGSIANDHFWCTLRLTIFFHCTASSDRLLFLFSGTPHSLGLNQVLNIAILGWSSMNARTDNSYRAAGPPLDELQRPCRDSSINTLRHPTVLLVSHLCGPATTGPHHS